MANPSLQIGNDNWAIKEDNLLGYSTAGTRFVPQPITMTRASAGTRVNSSGLVETVELLGSEEITNGDFANWTGDNPDNFLVLNENAANYVTESSNQLRMVSDNSATIAIRPQPTSMLTVGKIYKVSVDLTFTTGSIDISGTSFNSSGTKVFYINATTTYLQIAKTSALDVLIDNLSVKESTKNNLARVDYTDGTSSLLVEGQRTNLITYSEDFSQWTEVGSPTLTPDYGLSPDGTENSTRIELSTNARIYTSLSASGDIAFSVYLKGSGVITLRDNTNAYRQDVTLTSEWARYDLNFNATITNVQIQNQTASAVDCELWGTQCEVGSYPTSYIPTDGGTVTRVQDQYSKTGISNLINSEEGVWFLEIAALADDGTNRYISISSSTTPSDDYIYFRFVSTSNRVFCRTRVGGSTISTIEKTITDTTDYNKYAIKWKSGDYAFWINGVEVGTNTNSTIFGADVLNQIRFDFPVGSGTFPSKVKQLQVFKTALSDSELETLTT